jgi:hypothetical protein
VSSEKAENEEHDHESEKVMSEREHTDRIWAGKNKIQRLPRPAGKKGIFYIKSI